MMEYDMKNKNIMPKIVVIIPCYKVNEKILSVIAGIGEDVWKIIVIDDACPNSSGELVEKKCNDLRVEVLFLKKNIGVGGAVMTGYQRGIELGADVLVKLDGDGQMDPKLIFNFVQPILDGRADYTKGNRFFSLDKIKLMPKIRIFGNAALSFMAKLSTGYWNIFDPTNGYTAIHSSIASLIPVEKVSKRYFFETDILFRLSTVRAVVLDIPMDAKYENEVSNLHIRHIFLEFLLKHIRNTFKRIFYNYYLRDMSLVSIELPLGILLFLSGVVFGIYSWLNALSHDVVASAGTVMLGALPIIIGLQFILSFLNYDIANIPSNTLHRLNRLKN